MRFSKTLIIAAVLGLGLVAVTTPALAERSYTRCDRDGDRCWRVVCDRYGDYCRSYRVHTGYYGGDREYYRRSNHHYTGYRHWVCDRYGDCYWSYRRW